MPDQEDNMPNNKATLVDRRGEKTLHIEAEILPSGDLQSSGHDLSPVLQQVLLRHLLNYQPQ